MTPFWGQAGPILGSPEPNWGQAEPNWGQVTPFGVSWGWAGLGWAGWAGWAETDPKYSTIQFDHLTPIFTQTSRKQLLDFVSKVAKKKFETVFKR